MFCPKCGAEYRSGFTQCSDCHVALTDSPPLPEQDQSSQPDNELLHRIAAQPEAYVEFLILNNPGRLAVLKSVLESQAIPFFLQGEHYGTYFMMNNVRLLVPKEHADRVGEILSEKLALETDPGESGKGA